MSDNTPVISSANSSSKTGKNNSSSNTNISQNERNIIYEDYKKRKPSGFGKNASPYVNGILQKIHNGTYKKNRAQLRTNLNFTSKKIKGFDKKNTYNAQRKKGWLTEVSTYIKDKYAPTPEIHNIINPDTGSYVLEVAPMPEGLDMTVLKDMLKAYLSPRMDFYKKTKRSLTIEDEFSEWFIETASKGEQIGKGSTAMDIKSSNGDGIDAFCVVLNKSETNEKSLMQKFISSGKDLDTLFRPVRILNERF